LLARHIRISKKNGKKLFKHYLNLIVFLREWNCFQQQMTISGHSPGIDKIAQGTDETSLHCYISSGSDGSQTLTLITTTWDELFIHVGPMLEARLGDAALRARISSALHRILERQGKPFPLKQVTVDMEDFQRVKYQFWALGLIGRVDRWDDPQWTLTAYGRRYLVNILVEPRIMKKP
jgi:hypothetical protein